jgi:hypothetical protein
MHFLWYNLYFVMMVFYGLWIVWSAGKVVPQNGFWWALAVALFASWAWPMKLLEILFRLLLGVQLRYAGRPAGDIIFVCMETSTLC